MNLLKGSLLLKMAALLAAVLTYFYIHQEIDMTERKVSDPSYKLIKLTTRNLPIHVRLATSPPDGYRIVDEQVTSNPKSVLVVGPEALLESASSAETALVDVSESVKTVTKQIPLESVAGIPFGGEPYLVEVTVTIEKK